MLNFKELIKNNKTTAGAISIGFVLFIVCLMLIYQVYVPLDRNEGDKMFVIAKGDSLTKIAENLKTKRIISSDWSFIFYVWINRKVDNLQAGDYNLTAAMSISDVADKIVKGEVINNWVKVTIPEGWTNKQIEERLTKLNILKLEDYEAYKISTESFPFLNDRPQGPSLEGYLFPDTYYFEKDSTVEDITKKMLDNFGKKLNKDLVKEIEKQEKSIYEVVTLASIVQKEANSTDDMAKIASVFHNRLEIKMALQSDATINYITEGNARQPTIKETRTESPYNTYLHRDLPPGPICNPGIEAIKAVIYPAETDYFYFLHPLNSQAIFSKTLKEHNENKARYLK